VAQGACLVVGLAVLWLADLGWLSTLVIVAGTAGCVIALGRHRSARVTPPG
jgi:hypothetical protein